MYKYRATRRLDRVFALLAEEAALKRQVVFYGLSFVNIMVSGACGAIFTLASQSCVSPAIAWGELVFMAILAMCATAVWRNWRQVLFHTGRDRCGCVNKTHPPLLSTRSALIGIIWLKVNWTLTVATGLAWLWVLLTIGDGCSSPLLMLLVSAALSVSPVAAWRFYVMAVDHKCVSCRLPLANT